MADEAELEEPQVVQPEGEDDEPEDVIQFGDDDAPPASSEEEGTQLVRDLRVRLRDEARQRRADAQRIADLEAKVNPPVKAIDPGPKPTMESCDWDGEKFETELDAWKEATAKASAAKADAKRQQDADEADWATDLARYETGKSALRADYAEAEATIQSKLSKVQQMALVKAASNPALVVAALGKNADRLADLAKIADPIKFAVAVSKLEGTLKVTTNKRPPAPETVVKGSAPLTGGRSDRQLERLEAEAAKTGDRSKLIAFKRTLNRA